MGREKRSVGLEVFVGCVQEIEIWGIRGACAACVLALIPEAGKSHPSLGAIVRDLGRACQDCRRCGRAARRFIVIDSSEVHMKP
jgi:hypothetical protein